MHYQKYYPVDVVNGPGTRCTLFVSGCVHQCKGCYNQSTWRTDSGHLFTQAMEDQVIKDLNDSRIKRRGLSLSGGDPLHPVNVAAIQRLVERVRRECPDKDIWLWTGYTLAELNDAQQAVISHVDVVIDGKFEQEHYDPSLLWRGSANQVIHYLNVPESALSKS
ncbi:anaerobic ribonucleoside-triphosphate reductase-activating protein [Photobacterium ganghwense]|uniref:anaerobic ribonucleoside-triphosphate reductase-activating protein n=1 Tax=Photobacterium ganghwense TaxID=320778 RepID=UPI0039EF0645